MRGGNQGTRWELSRNWQFEIIRPLRLLDLDAFRHIFVEQASFFDPGFRGLRDKAYFSWASGEHHESSGHA